LGDLEGKTPKDRVTWITNAINQVKIQRPWLRADGTQLKNADGSLKWKVKPGKNAYSSFFDTVKLEGIARGSKSI